MEKITKLKEELQAKIAAKKIELQETIEARKIEIEMSRMDSPLYISRALEKEDVAKLDSIIALIEEQYEAEDRKLIHTYSYGVVVNKIMTILNAAMYSKAEQKEQLMAATNLTEQDIEDTIESFGKTSYWSPSQEEVIDAVPMNVRDLKSNLLIVADTMQLVSKLNISKINDSNIAYQYNKAAARAEESRKNHITYVAEADAEVVYSE